MMALQHLWANNVDLFSGSPDDIEVIVDNGENKQNAIRTFEWLRNLAQYSPNANGWEWGEAATALRSNDAASHMSIGIDPVLIKANQPDVLDQIFPGFYPTAEGADMSKWFTYFEGNVVRNDGGNTDGAKKFAEFMSKSPKIIDFVLTSPIFQFPPTKDQMETDQFQNNDLIKKYSGAVEMVKNNWDSMQAELLTADDGKPNPIAASSQINRAKGRATAQLLVNDSSPEETVNFLAEKLRSYK
jgi:multiple sugar transport system substrate-binding protein